MIGKFQRIFLTIKKGNKFEIGEKVLYFNAAEARNDRENQMKNGKDLIISIWCYKMEVIN